MPEQISPCSSRAITGGDDRRFLGPRNRQIDIVEPDADILRWIVRPIDAVARVRCRRDRLESMQESGWDVKVTEVDVVEHDAELTTERRRGGPDINEDVVYGTVGAANEFRLARTRSAMHPADHTLPRPRLRILHERGGSAGTVEVFVEEICVKRSGEKAAVVPKRLRCHQEDVGQLCGFDAHVAMVA